MFGDRYLGMDEVSQHIRDGLEIPLLGCSVMTFSHYGIGITCTDIITPDYVVLLRVMSVWRKKVFTIYTRHIHDVLIIEAIHSRVIPLGQRAE
jgi:hypothetical protein